MLVMTPGRRGLLFATVIAVFAVLLNENAHAGGCAPKDRSGACIVRSGAYFVRVPDTEERLDRLPIVMLLHDAGQNRCELHQG